MGIRYYNWVTGTFTIPDPIAGGNDTSYGYPTDPVNTTDTPFARGCAARLVSCRHTCPHSVHR